jgi:hypothetical protein
MIKIILLKSEHFIGVLSSSIVPLQILYIIADILNILIKYINSRSSLLDNLINFIHVEIDL